MNREFIEYLSARKNETLAVATILFTRGSTPRKGWYIYGSIPRWIYLWYYRWWSC